VFFNRLLEEFQNKTLELTSRVTELQAKKETVEVRTTTQTIEVPEPPASVKRFWAWLREPSANSKTHHYTTNKIMVPEVIRTVDPAITRELADLQREVEQSAGKTREAAKAVERQTKILGYSKPAVAAIFSAIVLVASLFVILSKRYKGESSKWAYGAIGTILGYWFS
jgi:hypothetical protein